MELELKIVRDPCRELAKSGTHVFGEHGGAMGRAPDNDWVLPDPHCYVSGRHCEFEFHGGGFWVRDYSRNGVYINDSHDRIGYGRQVMLHDGDRVKLGLYEIAVRVLDPNAPQADEASPAKDAHQETVALAHSQTQVAAEPAPIVGHPGVRSAESRPHVLLNRQELRQRGLLPPAQQERLISNQFRQIKRTLLANAFGKGGIAAVPNGRAIMVTSSLAGEGKTFSAWNLALSMAREQDLEVVIVDADSARPQATNVLGLRMSPGLLEALQDEKIDIESMILQTEVRGLGVLPAGRCDEDIATELLASARMEAIVARLMNRSNRVVLFDSAPILLTNESRVLATIVGQVVMVVRAGVTPQQAVKESIEYIGEHTPVGLVLNRAKADAPGSYYGYGSYGYGAYGTNENKQAEDDGL